MLLQPPNPPICTLHRFQSGGITKECMVCEFVVIITSIYNRMFSYRTTTFQEDWPELEQWFGEKQNILARVSADVDEGELYSKVESILQQVIQKRHEGNFLPHDYPLKSNLSFLPYDSKIIKIKKTVKIAICMRA